MKKLLGGGCVALALSPALAQEDAVMITATRLPGIVVPIALPE